MGSSASSAVVTPNGTKIRSASELAEYLEYRKMRKKMYRQRLSRTTLPNDSDTAGTSLKVPMNQTWPAARHNAKSDKLSRTAPARPARPAPPQESSDESYCSTCESDHEHEYDDTPTLKSSGGFYNPHRNKLPPIQTSDSTIQSKPVVPLKPKKNCSKKEPQSKNRHNVTVKVIQATPASSPGNPILTPIYNNESDSSDTEDENMNRTGGDDTGDSGVQTNDSESPRESARKSYHGKGSVIAAGRPKAAGKRRDLTDRQIIEQLVIRVKRLDHAQDFTSRAVYDDLKFIGDITAFSSGDIWEVLAEKLTDMGILDIFIKIWNGIYPTDFGSVKNSHSAKNLKKVGMIIWNISYRSRTMCKLIKRKGVYQQLISTMADPRLDLQEIEKNKVKLYLIKTVLGILHNVIHHRGYRELYRQCNAVDLLMKYFESQDKSVQIKSAIVLSYLIDERDRNIINDPTYLELLVGTLSKTLTCENHLWRKHGVCAGEALESLNMLVGDDRNKKILAEHGLIPLYSSVLQDDKSTDDEQGMAAQGLWTMALLVENRQRMREQPGCLEALHALSGSNGCPYHPECPLESVRWNTQGLLWMLGENKNLKKDYEKTMISPDQEGNSHIVLSYHTVDKAAMLKVKQRLEAMGYNVWMLELEQATKGPSMDEVAKVIDSSAAVVVGMSNKYQLSPSCRIEAEYAKKKGKSIIALRLRSKFRPYGWLARLADLATTIDLTKKEFFEMQVQSIARKLGTKGRGEVKATLNDDTMELTGPVYTSTPMKNKGDIYSAKRAVSSWDFKDIRRWMRSIEMKDHAYRFEGFTGQLLIELKKSAEESPDFFYNTLKEEFQFSMVNILKISNALKLLDTN